jgi:hypothetical protein
MASEKKLFQWLDLPESALSGSNKMKVTPIHQGIKMNISTFSNKCLKNVVHLLCCILFEKCRI